MKRALVTGGSGALGAAICRALAAAPLHVIVHSHAIGARRGRCRADPRSGRQRADRLLRRLRFCGASGVLEALVDAGGAIQVIVNNAGVHLDAPLAGMSEAQWDEVVDVSLKGFFNVTRPLLLPMMATRWGASSTCPR